MHPNRRTSHSALDVLAITALAMAVVAGCGDDGDDSGDATGAGSTPAAATTEVPATTEVTEDMATNIESLSYLMQGLLTTPQIGGGWVDMGRVVVPPSQEPQIGPLCPDGAPFADQIGTAMNFQAHTSFQQYEVSQATEAVDMGAAANPMLTGGSVMEAMLWNERQRVDAAFAAMKAATEACIGQEWTDPDMGDVVMTGFDAPAIGSDSFTSGYAPVNPPATDPWAESRAITVLMSDPSSPVSIVFAVSATVVHDDADQEVPAIDTAELIRIAEAASARIQAGM